jgi:very-short-patch-repair endonuclease
MKAKIIETARNLRKQQTTAEKAFWNKVRSKRFNGLKFRRQHPIEFEYYGEIRHFIADFYCPGLSLIVEIDGGIHERQKGYDKLRTEILSNMTYRVVRFSNKDVLENIEEVIKKLGNIIETSP